MNLRKKLGQRFVFALPGVKTLTDEVAEFLVDCQAGGVVLFGFNIESMAQIAKFNRDLQALAKLKNLPPFIISLDEEGGQVSRMPADGQDLIAPSQMALGMAGPEVVKVVAGITARRLRRLGFNFNYAPVMDINNNPANPVIGIRSYGASPQKVAQAGAAAIQAYLENDISPCVKHFPGHGDTDTDSHYGLPVVEKSLDQLREFELIPFQRAIEAGVPAIMTAHILYPEVEARGLPATFSPIFLSQLLRKQLGFEGLIITDCLDMRAIADQYDLGEAAILAFRAGADMVMLKGPLDEQRAAFEKAVAAAEASEFDVKASEETLARLAKWRLRFCLPPLDDPQPAQDYQSLLAAARQCLTIARADQSLLPLTKLNPQRPLLVDFSLEVASPADEGGRRPGQILEAQLQQGLPTLTRLQVGANPSEAEITQVQKAAAHSDLLIIVTRNLKRFAKQAELVHALLAKTYGEAPAVVVAAREPYDLDILEVAPVVILTYGDPPVTIKALAHLLLEGN